MIKIVKVEWSDENREEADITISDGINSIICFSSLFKYNVNDVFDDKLYCLNVENLYKSLETQAVIEKKEDFYEYFVRGILVEKESLIVCVGEIQIDISAAYIPGDICVGDVIEFTVSRLDIY